MNTSSADLPENISELTSNFFENKVDSIISPDGAEGPVSVSQSETFVRSGKLYRLTLTGGVEEVKPGYIYIPGVDLSPYAF